MILRMKRVNVYQYNNSETGFIRVNSLYIKRIQIQNKNKHDFLVQSGLKFSEDQPLLNE